MLKKDRIEKQILTLALIFCAFCEFVIIQYFNICEAKEHMGIDSSWEYLKTIVLSKEGGYYPQNVLSATTSPGTGKIFLLFAPLNNVIGNIWISYGIGMMIISVLAGVILWSLMNRLGFTLIVKLIILNLFLCPYLANGFDICNDLGYFSCTNGTPGYENIVVLLLFLTLLILSYENLRVKEITIIVITLSLYVYQSISAGSSLLIFFGTPALLYVVLKTCLLNDYKQLYKWKAIFLYLTILSMVLGCKLGALMGLTYRDSVINWITAPQFFANIQNEFLGFMMLVGAMPGTGALRQPTSLYGISYLFGLIIFSVIVISIIYVTVQYIKNQKWTNEDNDVVLFSLATIAVISSEFALVYTNAGQDIFENRYLLNSLLCGMIMVGYFILSLDDKLIFKRLGILTLTIAIIEMNLFSDYMLATIDNRSFMVDEIKSEVDNTDAGLVYFWEEEENFIPTYSVIRIIDQDRVYKCISKKEILTYGQYKYYEHTSEYVGATVLIINENNPAPPESIIQNYKKIAQVNNMGIYYSASNPIDLDDKSLGLWKIE